MLLVVFTKLSFILWQDIFFLFIHFLVVEDYELPKSTSHILSVPITLEWIQILSWSISFLYFHCFPDVFLHTIPVWTDDTALNSSCDKPSDEPTRTSFSLILKIWTCNTSNIRKYNHASSYILCIILYLQVNSYRF